MEVIKCCLCKEMGGELTKSKISGDYYHQFCLNKSRKTGYPRRVVSEKSKTYPSTRKKV